MGKNSALESICLISANDRKEATILEIDPVVYALQHGGYSRFGLPLAWKEAT